MFIAGTGVVFEKLPDLEALTAVEARRNLSIAYLDAFNASINARRSTGQAREEYEDYLRRLANSLESHAVFDENVDLEIRLASAFVAAESLMLLVDLVPEETWGDFSIENPFVFNALEASLLYLASGYDANAEVIIKRLQSLTTTLDIANNETIALSAIATICGGRSFSGSPQLVSEAMILADPTVAARSVVFSKISAAIVRFLSWRGGEDEAAIRECIAELGRLISVLTPPAALAYADILHLSQILSFALVHVTERAIRNVAVPITGREQEYRRYLLERGKGRPLIWPTAVAYAKECLPGPHVNAVVNVPTGGGKSFIAELAISQAILTGWALYLVPTNALANQVRKDLETALSSFEGLDVRAFLGGEEYTDLSTEQLQNVTVGTVVVMTPEKCALALRLSESVFSSCKLCVFDECHLLGEGSRGALAELVLSHVIALAGACKFLLMSAMMSNADELAQWIEDATGQVCVPIKEAWRPTRTMRGLLGTDGNQASAEYRAACEFLRNNPKRRTKSFYAEHAVLTNLQGIWDSEHSDDYALAKLPFRSKLTVERKGRRFPVASWINTVAIAATRNFSDNGHSVLTFLPANPHYAFSVGESLAEDSDKQVELNLESTLLLQIAEDELGGKSMVRELLSRGIAVHTARLLDSEKSASELCFRRKQCSIMLATGTLAQGLNLPATVVLIGGTNVGDVRKATDPDHRQYSKAQLLNALGRAGRAGFANRGISLLIPDQFTALTTNNRLHVATANSDILSADENSTRIVSRLEGFLQSILDENLTVESTSQEFLTALSYLPITEGSTDDIEAIIGKTLAVRRFPAEHRGTFARLAKEWLTNLGSEYLTQMGAPHWLPTVSYRTGLPLVLCVRIHQAFLRVAEENEIWPTGVLDWFGFLSDCVKFLTPVSMRRVLGEKLNGVPASVLWDEDFDDQDDPAWQPPARWEDAIKSILDAVRVYMTGGTIDEIGREFLGVDSIRDFDRTSGKPVPKTLNLVKSIVERLSQVAGALIVIEEQTRDAEPRDLSNRSKLSLSSLPLAVKYGCDDRSSLAWYRFGVRYRRPAHVLSRIMSIPDEELDDDASKRWIARKKDEFLVLDLGDFDDILTPQEIDLLGAVQSLEGQ